MLAITNFSNSDASVAAGLDVSLVEASMLGEDFVASVSCICGSGSVTALTTSSTMGGSEDGVDALVSDAAVSFLLGSSVMTKVRLRFEKLKI
jgi:hypothetical protein